MIDFSSALYLGLRHPMAAMQPWAMLTTGVPAGLRESEQSRASAHRLARIQGQEAGVLAPASLHLSWDFFWRAGPRTIWFADERVYPVIRWGLERAAGAGRQVHLFRHGCPADAAAQLRKHLPPRAVPWIVTDSWCPQCGKPAPLRDYVALLAPYGGRLLVDDTQTLGILGSSPSGSYPYGSGGGGILPWTGLAGRTDIVLIASMAKGLGAPAAILSGPRREVSDFVRRSEVRIHTSPVSAAALSALSHALDLNARSGSELRSRLLSNVDLFRQHLRRAGLLPKGGRFPVQVLSFRRSGEAEQAYQRLKDQGVSALLLAPHTSRRPDLCFCLRADHHPEAIMTASRILTSSRAISIHPDR